MFILNTFLSQNIFLIILELALIWFVHTRVVMLYYKKWYYERQGVPFVKGVKPVLGHLIRMMYAMMNSKTNDHPLSIIVKEDFPEKVPGIFGVFNGFEPSLFISDLDMLNDLYITKNKYFDKDD
jgi:hypothetical protein